VTGGLLDEPVARAWAHGAQRALDAARERIDAVNVFPVADADTGTNTLLTVRGAADALDALPDGSGDDAALAALARGALLAARGSSGIILSRYLGALAGAARDGADLPTALATAAAGAREAVPDPQDGTMLTMAAVVAEAVRAGGAAVPSGEGPGVPGDRAVPGAEAADRSAAVLAAALDVGRGALDRVSAAHPVLREARVVDSGACALLVVLDALAVALATAGRPAAPTAGTIAGPIAAPSAPQVDLDWLPAAPRPSGDRACGVPITPGAVEVMAVLPGSALPDLADRLHGLGDAVAVVAGVDADGGPVRHAHVHTTDPAPVLALLRDAGAHEARVEALDAAAPGAVVDLVTSDREDA
jgi:dihydroxyacetone kinase-like predicted kinase